MQNEQQIAAKPKVLVVGNGMVGHKFIDCLLDAKGDGHHILTFSEEPRLAYDRVQLSSYFSGASVNDLMLTSEQYYQEKGVSFLLRDKVVELDREQKCVITESGRKEDYDKLVLATGSFPFVPPIPGNDQEHCLVYRTIEDLEAITASAQSSKVGVVVGGGLLGLEAANALKHLGLESHVVEFAPRLMAVQLDEGGGALLRRKIESLGVGVHTEKATKEIVAGSERRYRMNFADGSFLETDMIVFSAGIRPQDALAREFGLDIGERGGIVVNNFCQTSDENIYAIGECALWGGRIFGLVSPGYTMAKVAACHISGDCEEFVGADMSTKLKLLGVDVASIGDAHGRTQGCLNYSYYDDSEEVYKSLVVSADGKHLLGAVLVGDVSDYGGWLQLMLNKLEIPTSPEELLFPKEDVVFDVESLPQEALICACNSVTKGQIEQAVIAGARDMNAIKQQTLASTGCGSCGALAEQVFEAKMADLGYEVGGPADAVAGIFLSGLSAGNISPDKLLALGAITKEFNLSTQVAGDNRLELVGVSPEQLLVLEQRLSAAGLA
ncbi:nitrite reductase large subunit NirB [Halioxenophilus aromaticivorans]|uniref:Nitrite reductase (NAD(P)H) n=1 Tax=Halioxenophilus aromaticivorans TaxID=1306992 RepID=A0AAV3U9X8_9ALTE